MTNLARDRLRTLLGDPSRAGPFGHPTAGLPIRLALVQTAPSLLAPLALDDDRRFRFGREAPLFELSG